MPAPVGNLREAPPDSYWDSLSGHPQEQLRALQRLFQERADAIPSYDVPGPHGSAVQLLSHVAQDGWLQDERRYFCPGCGARIDDSSLLTCAECNGVIADLGGLKLERWFTRNPLPEREVAWVLALHGMNTSGVWQEQFNWLMATTWGRSVPVPIYKYGNVKTGVLLPFRRRRILRDLRDRLIQLQDGAASRGIEGLPDAVAHSFGTWLLGHLLAEEAQLGTPSRLKFGRIILTGSILRPDFDWDAIRRAGLVGEVLNHYGTADKVVQFAELTISDSGPSGRRGFDDQGTLNVPAEGYGHGTFFSTEDDPIAVDNNCQPVSRLRATYDGTWSPFLRLPAEELRSTLRTDPPCASDWRPLWWPLRATVLPAAILVAAVALLVLCLFGIAWAFTGLPQEWQGPVSEGALRALAFSVGIGIAALSVGLLARRARG